MRAFSILSVAFLFVAAALGVTVTNPAQDTRWDAGVKTQTVAWTSVATDHSSLTIVLVNMQTYPNINIVLKENVVTSAGSTTVDAPSSGWPTGSGFQINLDQPTTSGVGILAQSQQFNITGTTTPFQSTQSSTAVPSPVGTNNAHGGSGKNTIGLTAPFDFIVGLALIGALLA
ncbi:hypothetical protein BDM02DRAFT_3123186 [Thelephora ganbajun]|uniref:Uncharacterized protein n=1 Tax=Thelephora ganbajun TaxID=370292 RepID=A0ACB6Z286_THEGA|nr:hypothetical protein BDM02DRAFT_3123186 [Thelephora ganbajun]